MITDSKMTDHEDLRERTLTKYQELNDQLREFLKNILLFEKSSSAANDSNIPSADNDDGGISLLSIKNDLLLQYIVNLVAVMYRRSRPEQSLTSSSTRSMILRLCEIRSYLEKLRPIEQKLQYQIDKVLKSSVDQQLQYRANLANFDEDVNGEDEETTTKDEDEETKPKIYRPPKLVPMEYNEDLDRSNGKTKIDKRLEHLKRRAYHSDILEDFKMKYSDAPEEVHNNERSRLMKQNRAYQEKIAYEEEYLKRLPQTKRDRLQLQRSLMNDGSDVMKHLDDANVLFDEKFNGSTKKKKGKMSRQTKKKMEKKKGKSVKRLKSRK